MGKKNRGFGASANQMQLYASIPAYLLKDWLLKVQSQMVK